MQKKSGFVMLLLSSRNIHSFYVITFLNSLLKGLQGFSTLVKQIISHEIRLKCNISDHNMKDVYPGTGLSLLELLWACATSQQVERRLNRLKI